MCIRDRASSAVAVGQASSGKLAKLAKLAELIRVKKEEVLEGSGKRKPAANAAEHLDGKDLANKRKKQKVVGERHHGGFSHWTCGS